MKEAIEDYLARGGTLLLLLDHAYREIYADWCESHYRAEALRWRTLPELSAKSLDRWIRITNSGALMTLFSDCVLGRLDAAQAAQALVARLSISWPVVQRWAEEWRP